MSYFSKEIYYRKREHAYSISEEGLELIATYLVSENPKYKNVDLDDDEVSDEIDSEIEDVFEFGEKIYQRFILCISSAACPNLSEIIS